MPPHRPRGLRDLAKPLHRQTRASSAHHQLRTQLRRHRHLTRAVEVVHAAVGARAAQTLSRLRTRLRPPRLVLLAASLGCTRTAVISAMNRTPKPWLRAELRLKSSAAGLYSGRFPRVYTRPY